MKDLFDPISRDERQQQCVSKWIKKGGKATIEACTGFGKIFDNYFVLSLKKIILVMLKIVQV